MVLMLFLSTGAQGADWEAALEAGIGLDDNVARSASGKASGFILWGGEASVHFQPAGAFPLLISGYLYGRYQDYLSAGDNHLLGMGLDLSAPLMAGVLTPGITLEGSVLRDGERPDEDRNVGRIAGRLRWLAGDRLTVLVQEAWSRRAYDDPVLCGTDPAGMGPGRRMGQQGEPCLARPDRRDDLLVTELVLSFYPAPTWVTALTGTYARNDSSIAPESYTEGGGALRLTWVPSPRWEFSAEGGWRRAAYDTFEDLPDRRDDLFRVGAGASRVFSAWELYFDLAYENNDSTWESETYHRMVTRCGVLWHF